MIVHCLISFGQFDSTQNSQYSKIKTQINFNPQCSKFQTVWFIEILELEIILEFEL